MRVTQTMLSNSTLRHMTNSYQQMGKIQDQFSTGKKISRASQDPVVAMHGMRYRSQVTEVEQFKRNLGEVYNWMDTADATLDTVTQSLHRIRELAVQASNDTYEETQRGNIAKEVAQLREHLISLGNTRANNKYIFNGTNTTNAPIDSAKMNIPVDDPNFIQQLEDPAGNIVSFPFEVTYGSESYRLQEIDNEKIFVSDSGKKIQITNGGNTLRHEYQEKDQDGNEITVNKSLKKSDLVVSYKDAVSINNQNVEVELLKGVKIAVNINPSRVFSNDFFGELSRLENTLKDTTTKAEDITGFMDRIDKQIDNVVNERAELGARYNRVEMIDSRIWEQEVIAQRILSNNEDADMEKVIIDLKSQESLHRAALAAGARIMQPTLMDFLR